MSYYDLQDLKHRIQTLGKNIHEQENFYGDINSFLHQVYQREKTVPGATSLRSAQPARTLCQ